MASVFKLKGRTTKHDPYQIEYTDHKGKRRRTVGYTDKRLSEQKGAQLEREAQLRRDGLVDPEDEKRAEQNTLPIAKHLVAYQNSLGKNTEKYVCMTMTRIKRVIESAGIGTLSDIDLESVEEAIADIQEEDDLGNRTVNHYMDAIDGFCRWLVPKRALTNPLTAMDRLNADVDIRHRRRALSKDEIAKLLESARLSNESIQCYSGEERAFIYIFSYLTGLRRREMGSLRKHSFKLNSRPPTVTVEAACSKHRREDVLPLHPHLVTLLKEFLQGMESEELLFPKLEKRRTWLMVKKDLARVGIPYETHEGIADFHAAGRHSHITGLLESGASLAETKELARHCDVRMTMKYAHIGISSRAKALTSLPVPSSEENESSSGLVSMSVHSDRQPDANRDGNRHEEAHQENEVNEDETTSYVSTREEMAPAGTQNASQEHAGSIPAASIWATGPNRE